MVILKETCGGLPSGGHYKIAEGATPACTSSQKMHADVSPCLPDEAAERGKQALALGRRGFGDLLARARKLDAALRSRYPKEPGRWSFGAAGGVCETRR